MRPSDRRLGLLPARLPEPAGQPIPSPPPPPSPMPPAERGGPSFEGFPVPRRRLSVRLVGRALRRHWWQALLVWAAGSAGLMTLARGRGEPAYVASSTIAIRSDDPSMSPESQARRVTDPDVVASALSSHPELGRIPRLSRGNGPASAIREAVVATAGPEGRSIRVAMSGDSPGELTSVVDAVVEAYLEDVREGAAREAEARVRGLRQAREDRLAEVRKHREAVARLVEKIGSVDSGRARERDSTAAESYAVLTRELLKGDLELLEARASLDRLRAAPPSASPVGSTEAGPEVVAAFYAEPRVAEARGKLERARDSLEKGEPGASKARVDQARARINALWAELGPGLMAGRRRPVDPEAEVRAAEARVASVEARTRQLALRLEALNEQTRSAGLDELALEFARQDLGRAESVLDAVTKGADQADLGPRGSAVQPLGAGGARVARTPEAEFRRKAMAAIPGLMLLAVVGLFSLVELRAGRVSDPEDVPGRLRLEVLGVVPPLPRAGDRRGARARRDLGRFAQAMDHLRVAIGSSRDERGRPRRSLVITSARKGEGKTTLAAQLAERSARAGLLTLLVDADLRNPALSRTLELDGRRGLADLLDGGVTAEEVIAVLGEGGRFHVLPAGTPRVDPGRLLQDGRLARFLARARESFDLVIVDAPPILPVPDALIVGRSVDGVVLAVRFDRSRFPLLERAGRRLAAVGSTVLGAVVVGVPGGDGTYDPAYTAALEDDGLAML